MHSQTLQLIFVTEVCVASVIERMIRALTGCVHRLQQIAGLHLSEVEILCIYSLCELALSLYRVYANLDR